MDPLFTRLSPILHLTRVTTAFAAIGNVWFVILWTRAEAVERKRAATELLDRDLWWLLGGGTLYAIALFMFGMALNDTLDVRRDRALHPERPIPSGQVSIDTAARLVACTLLLAVLGAMALGGLAVFLALLTAGAILFYNAGAKYVPSIGLVALGLIYAAHMIAANIELVFVWPVWLVMTHALILGAVTHRLGKKRPRLSGAMIGAAGVGWLFWSGVLLYAGYRRTGGLWPEWVSPWAAVGPGVLALLFIVLAVLKARQAGSGPRAAEKLQRYGMLWLTLYATAWMLGQGHRTEGLILGGLALAGFLGMTVLREVYGLLEHPVKYRR